MRKWLCPLGRPKKDIKMGALLLQYTQLAHGVLVLRVKTILVAYPFINLLDINECPLKKNVTSYV